MSDAPTQRGMSESVQWAVLMPLLLFIVLGLIQGGIWLHGRTVASNAALATAEQAALLDSSTDEARELGQKIAAQGGLADVQVTVSRSSSEASATVTGRMPTFVDLGQTQVRQQAVRPRERVTRP